MVTTSSTVTSAARYFYDHGGVVTSAAGNYSTFDSTTDNPYILTVSGTDLNDALYSWLNTGNNVDLAAPGCAGNTTTNGGGYASACGTSFAPIVAGVAALVLSRNPSLPPAQVTTILRQSSDHLGPGDGMRLTATAGCMPPERSNPHEVWRTRNSRRSRLHPLPMGRQSPARCPCR